MDIMDRVNALANNSLDTNSVTVEPTDPKAYDPIRDLAGAVSEWADEAQKAGERIAKAAGEMYANDSSMAILDEMALPNNDMSSANAKLAMALENAIDEARYDVTKDPLSIAGDIGGAVAPWVPMVVQLPIALKEMGKMTEGGKKSTGEAASDLGLPMLAGSVAASAAHTLGGKLGKVSPLASRILTTPFVGSSMAAGGTLAASPEMRQYATEHPARFAFNMFTTDAAIGAKKLVGKEGTSRTNPFMANDTLAKNTDISTDTQKIESASEGAAVAGADTGTLHAKSAGSTVNEVQPLTTKESTPVTPREEAFPEDRPDVRESQNRLAQQVADDIQEAKRTSEVMQGAYGDELVASKDNLYPTSVSINQIWETFKRLVPIRPNNMREIDSSTLGYFHKKGKGIRVRGFRAWSVMCHELGHAASNKFGFGDKAEVQAELANGARSIWSSGEYGDFNSPDGYAVYVEEGRAAFMNEYLINPEMARKHFPLTTVAFENAIKKDPIWDVNMATIGQQVRRWCNMNTAQKASGSKQWGDVDNTTIAQKIQKAVAGVEKAYVDEFADLRAIKEVYEDIAGVKVRIEADPSAVAQDAKQAINATEACLLDGNGFTAAEIIPQIANKYQVPLHEVVATDLFLPFNVGGERGIVLKEWLKEKGLKDYYEAAINYQTAKHELELIKVKNAERIEKVQATAKALGEKIDKQLARLNEADKTIDDLLHLSEGQDDELLKIARKKQVLEKARLAQLRKKLARTLQKINDIKAGKDDYLTSMTKAQNEEIVKWAEEIPEFERFSELWKKWHENTLRIAVAGGILKKETMKDWLTTYPEYIPLKRDFSIEGKDTMSGDIRHVLSEEGSDRVVADPLVQAILDMKAIVSKVERNRVNQAVANLSRREYGHYLLMEVKDNTAAEAHRIITVYEKGVPHYYQCMADGLYEAITSTNKSFVKMNLDVLSKTQRTIADMLRIGATNTPAFAVWNLSKDVVDATILNKDGRGDKPLMIHKAITLLWDGAGVVLSQNKLLEKMATKIDEHNGNTKYMDAILANRRLKAEYIAGGVQYTAMLSDKKGINLNFRRIVSPETKLQKVGKVLYSPIKSLTTFNEACEQIARMGIYKRVSQRGGTAFEARYHAADSTVNFMRSGTKTKEINRVTPFFNATIQGTAKLYRAFKEDPYGVSLACFQIITLPTLFCYWLNKDEDWYRDMPLEQKNKAWYLKINGTIHVFPKPQFLGQIFGSLPERVLDLALEGDDREAALSCLEEAALGLLPMQTSPATTKFYEWQANKNFYTGRPIVDQRLGKVSPKYQYDIYTSEIAKRVGAATNLSPKKIDNTFYGITASMGYAFMGATDLMLKDTQTPSKKWTERTRFTYAEGGRHTRSQDVFYKNLDKLETQANDTKLNGMPLKDNKQLKGMQESKQLAALITNGEKTKTPKKLLRKLGKWAHDPDVKRGIRAIENDKTLDGATKREKIDKLVKIRNNIYRSANKNNLNYKYIQSPE